MSSVALRDEFAISFRLRKHFHLNPNQIAINLLQSTQFRERNVPSRDAQPLMERKKFLHFYIIKLFISKCLLERGNLAGADFPKPKEWICSWQIFWLPCELPGCAPERTRGEKQTRVVYDELFLLF